MKNVIKLIILLAIVTQLTVSYTFSLQEDRHKCYIESTKVKNLSDCKEGGKCTGKYIPALTVYYYHKDYHFTNDNGNTTDHKKNSIAYGTCYEDYNQKTYPTYEAAEVRLLAYLPGTLHDCYTVDDDYDNGTIFEFYTPKWLKPVVTLSIIAFVLLIIFTVIILFVFIVAICVIFIGIPLFSYKVKRRPLLDECQYDSDPEAFEM